MYLLIYDIITGDIVSATSVSNEIMQTVESFTANYPEEKKKRISGIYADNVPFPTTLYKVIDGAIVRRTDQEINEIYKYKKILTEEERQLEKLKPSPEEISKAKNTIEILNLIQEVM